MGEENKVTVKAFVEMTVFLSFLFGILVFGIAMEKMALYYAAMNAAIYGPIIALVVNTCLLVGSFWEKRSKFAAVAIPFIIIALMLIAVCIMLLGGF